MAIKLAFINNKGGSAKTTSLVNIAGAINTEYPNKKILIIEGDAQGNASTSFGLEPDQFHNTIYDVFMNNCTAGEAIINAHESIDIIPANMDMNFLEFDIMETYDHTQRENTLDIIHTLNAQDIDFSELDYDTFESLTSFKVSNKYFNMLEGRLDDLDSEYDIILFDTPPELKSVTSSVLAVADKAIIPFEPDVYSLDGIVNIMSRIMTIKEEYNPNLEVGGILASKVRVNTNLHRDIMAKVKEFCADNDIHYFDTHIPSSIRFASSTAYRGKPATISVPNNEFSRSYFDLLQEMIDNKVIDWSEK